MSQVAHSTDKIAGPSIGIVKGSYPLSFPRRMLLLTTGAFLFIIPALLIFGMFHMKEASGIYVSLFVGILMLGTVSLLLFSAWYPHLEVRSDGVEVRGAIGYSKFFVPWEDIDSLRLIRWSEGLILRKPLTIRAAQNWKNWSGVTFGGAPMYSEDLRELIDEACYVPLAIFGCWSKDGVLMKAIKEYAPHLIENLEKERAEGGEEAITGGGLTKENKLVLLLVFGFTGLIVAASIFVGLYYPEALEHLGALNNIGRYAGYAAGFAMALYGMVNIRASYHFLRNRKPWYALFWLVAAIVQLLVAILFVAPKA